MKSLSVLYQSDNNYAVLTGISILSLFENNQHLERITVYYLDDNIHPDNKEKILSIGKKYNRDIIFIETHSILQKLKDLNVVPYKGTYTTYFKLFAINDIQNEEDRILQLDGDTIINEPLDELITYDLEGSVCAATYDCILNDYKSLIDIPLQDKYYNCGVLLINKKMWKDYGCEEKILDHILHKRNRYQIVDQDLINVLFRDKIKYLHCKYNLNSGFYIYGVEQSYKMYDLTDRFFSTQEQVYEAINKPYINHCMGSFTGRPWHKENIHPQSDLYDTYYKISPWNDLEKMPCTLSLTHKIQRFMYLYFPKSLFCFIYKIMKLRNYKKINTEIQKL
ncbi:MAG: glycosyltransferase [Bacillota bacterium]|nr:glycosyltransferase [Bacillota bacterium]